MRSVFASLGISALIVSCVGVKHPQDQLKPDASCSVDSCSMPQAETDSKDVLSHCPSDMSFVSGMYCSSVEQKCAHWLDKNQSVCEHYSSSKCVGSKVYKEFCIETDEHTEVDQKLPTTNVDLLQAQSICQKEGRRLCEESEWNFACEGEDVWPYATGFYRPEGICNIGIKDNLGPVDKRTDYRASVENTSACISSFGVRNMSGNVDEITIRNVTPGKFSLALKGGAWMFGHRNRCRPATTAHNELYSSIHVGFRCCSDANQ